MKEMTKKEMIEVLQKFVDSNFGKKHDLFLSVETALKNQEKLKKDSISTLYQQVKAAVDEEKASREQRKKETLKKKSEDEKMPPDKTESKGKKKLLKPKVEKPLTPQSEEITVMFPDTLEVEGLGVLKICDHIKTYDEVVEWLGSGKPLYAASVWTARQIQKYKYGENFFVSAPKSFPHGLDISQLIFTNARIDRAWAVSYYTEAMFRFEGTDFEYIDDKTPSGEKISVRVSNGAEFELYTSEEEEAK